MNTVKLKASVLLLISFLVGSPSPHSLNNTYLAELATTINIKATNCQPPPRFQTIHHTGKRQLDYLALTLAPSAGIDPASLSNYVIERKDGTSEFMAMTCTEDGNVWFSASTFKLLSNNPFAITWIYSHELAHHNHPLPVLILETYRFPGAVEAFERMNRSQLLELGADQVGIDILFKAGYPIDQIPTAIEQIARKNGIYNSPNYGGSHPHPQERQLLAAAYIWQRYGINSRP